MWILRLISEDSLRPRHNTYRNFTFTIRTTCDCLRRIFPSYEFSIFLENDGMHHLWISSNIFCSLKSGNSSQSRSKPEYSVYTESQTVCELKKCCRPITQSSALRRQQISQVWYMQFNLFVSITLDLLPLIVKR